MSLQFSCFVTGTDTEIGKTLISATLLQLLVKNGLQSIGMKPIAAGVTQHDGITSNDDIDALTAASNMIFPRHFTTPYLLKAPAAPHLAANDEGVEISVDHIVDCYQTLAASAQAVVVEGVGGFCVPLSADTDTADLAERLNLPVIMVVGMRLGCLNHALLTAAAIHSRKLTLAGWVANCVSPSMLYPEENIDTLRRRLDAPWIGTVPPLQAPSAANAAPYLEPARIAGWPTFLA